MAAKYRVALFLEDRAHESFILPLCQRLIQEEGYDLNEIALKPLHSHGGDPMGSFKRFLKDARRNSALKADLIIVARDANCKGYRERSEAIRRLSEKHSPSPVIPAIPDPHVERWFMIDMNALRQASGLPLVGEAPPYKCDKDRYKKLLREVFRGTGVSPPLGGVEYGPRVVEKLDLYSACRLDTGLN
jgi:hypothetical protein